MRRKLLLLLTHGVVLALGFALGIYALPILIAPPPAADSEIARVASEAPFRGRFSRDLAGSDWLHWGEGEVYVAARSIALRGRLAPGPDYKLYLSPQFVETGEDFLRLRAGMVRVGDVRGFENIIVAVPETVDVARYGSVVVWCETFRRFISAARYR